MALCSLKTWTLQNANPVNQLEVLFWAPKRGSPLLSEPLHLIFQIETSLKGKPDIFVSTVNRHNSGHVLPESVSALHEKVAQHKQPSIKQFLKSWPQ